MISAHEKSKKELLVLPLEQLIVLVTLALNKYTAGLEELEAMLHRASERAPGLGSWTYRKLRLLEGKLLNTPFVFSSYRGLTVHTKWRNTLVFAADALRPEQIMAIIQSISLQQRYPVTGATSARYGLHYDDLAQRCVHKILLNQVRDFEQLYHALQQRRPYEHPTQTAGRKRIDSLLATVDWTFWKTRDPYFQWSALSGHQNNFGEWTENTPVDLERMLSHLLTQPEADEYLEEVRAVVLLGMHYYRERPDTFAEYDPGLAGVCYLAAGNTEAAAEAFARMPPHDRQLEAGMVHVIRAAFAYGRGDWDKARLLEEASTFTQSHYPSLINCFLAYVYQETEDSPDAEALLEQQIRGGVTHPTEWVVALWSACWMGMKLRRKDLLPLFDQLAMGQYRQLPWIEGEITEALHRLFPGDARFAEARTPVQGEVSLLGLLPVKPNWVYALRQLQQTGRQTSEETNEEPAYRTIWIIDFDGEEAYCKEQKKGKRGWSKGRRIKWNELLHPKHPAALHTADGRAINALRTRNDRPIYQGMYYNEDNLTVDFGHLLHELADHPRLYLGDTKRIPLELFRAEPELRVTEKPDGTGIRLAFVPDVEGEGYVWEKETPTRYRVYHLDEKQTQIAWAISGGIDLPADQRPVLENIVERIRPAVRVQSAFDLIDEDLEKLHGSPLPCFHLLPFGEGYKVELYVKPLPEEPFYFKPGDGMARSIIVLEDGRKILERPLALETEEAAAAILACPTLAATPQTAYEWTVEDTTTALRILLELRGLLADQLVSIEHPKGEKLRIVGQAGSDELAVRVGKNRDWFEVNGKLTVSEDRVVDLERLLAQLRSQDHPFIELGEGEFVAITEELRDRIMEMEGLLHRKGDKLQLPTLAAGVFAEVTDDLADLEFDDAWQESLDRITKADKIRPRVPKSFRAELRDYQKDGFRWLMRLAAWGVGGCLADDMGLGKTVQALAMLAARADQGPSLVIAPASVTRNWLSETERFAPSLVPVLIASGADTPLLSQLGTGDLALVSYGLLPFIGEELTEIGWANIILDEAQAIKNAATKRAKTVQQLRGDFKLATTGTPIENHLGELWSLFRFLNPGLLGGKTAFNEKYNRPIARDGDEDRRNALKNLVKPFILRRRKDEVLTELPPKTEIVLNVNLSEEEKALYEAMRRNAVREIAAADEQQKRFTVLAQLTKLRQAACHPRLVRPHSKLGSAKLELVGETLLEILESGHKALIFSQFVKHLKIVENWVKGQGIAYQYLDGSTPGKRRAESVEAFQAGEGQVFLISLKAGGTGLNLTAADYVLHLDPWWNPAAEDQASDRAHRIGQQRPVTVYRFVSAGTIEEQIIALHAEKRDLADQILAGTGQAGALSVEEIMGMLR